MVEYCAGGKKEKYRFTQLSRPVIQHFEAELDAFITNRLKPGHPVFRERIFDKVRDVTGYEPVPPCIGKLEQIDQ